MRGERTLMHTSDHFPTGVTSTCNVHWFGDFGESGALIMPKPIGGKANAAMLMTSERFPDWILGALRSSI